MMKASGTRAWWWSNVVAGALVALVAGGAARAADDKDTSGKLTTWTVTDGKDVLGSESLRVVTKDGGAYFASGELKLKAGKKAHRKSHIQRDSQGKILKYQRVEAGLKGAGYRMFEWQGQMRIAPINGSGKPVDVGAVATPRLVDENLWHLYATWDLPGRCESTSKAFFDLAKRESGQARLDCVGSKKVYDDKGGAVDVHRFSVGGVAGEAVELWVDKHGALVGAKGESRTMLRAKYSLEPGKAPAEVGDGEGEPDKDAIKDRGVGE